MTRPRPDGGDEAATGPEHAGDLAGGRRTIDHVHQTQRCQDDVERRRPGRDRFGATLVNLHIREIQGRRGASGVHHHLPADVDAHDASCGSDADRRSNCNGAGTCAEVENPFTRLE